MALTNQEIAHAKIKDKDYKLADGKGLFLLIRSNGAKYWRWSYRYGGKQKTMALGVYPEVTAKKARAKHQAYRELLSERIDPAEWMKEQAQEKIKLEEKGKLIREVLVDFLAYYSEGKDQKTIDKAEGFIRNWINPVIGDIACSNITAQDVLKVIRNIEASNLRPTAHKVSSILNNFFAYCIAEPKVPIDRNWLIDIKPLIKPAPEKHHPALVTPQAVGKLLVDVGESKSYWTTKLAIRLSLHWFIRPGELRTLLWENVNWEINCIQISKDKMKQTGFTQDHWVPLSRQAREILEFLRDNNRPSVYIFPSIRNLSNPMSDGTVNVAIKSMGYVGRQTAHGLRATARTLLDEELKQNPDYIEHQLAHKVRDVNGRAYNRTTKLDERRVMLQLWSDYLDDLEYKTKEGIEIKSVFEQATGSINEKTTNN